MVNNICSILAEAELDWLDVRINPKKSSCIRFGARFGVECSNISTSDDSKLPWSDNFRYLGVYLRSSRSFACSFSHAKHSMHRAFNAIVGKVGRIASPDVVVHCNLLRLSVCQYYATVLRYVLPINLILDPFSMLWITVFVRYSTLN